MTILCTSCKLLQCNSMQLRQCMTIWELPHNENLLILGKRWAEYCTLLLTNLLRGAQKRKPSCKSNSYKTHCTSARFWDRSNVQQHLQTVDFQSVERLSIPRSKFVKMALWVIARLSVLYSFGRSTPSEGVGKCAKTRLLRKECRKDLRRKWLEERFLAT